MLTAVPGTPMLTAVPGTNILAITSIGVYVCVCACMPNLHVKSEIQIQIMHAM